MEFGENLQIISSKNVFSSSQPMQRHIYGKQISFENMKLHLQPFKTLNLRCTQSRDISRIVRGVMKIILCILTELGLKSASSLMLL